MCFWGKSTPIPSIPPAPTPAPPPAPAPLPAPVPTETAPMKTAEERRKRIEAARYGMLSTIKTSPLGLVGAGSDLTSQGRGKAKLGM